MLRRKVLKKFSASLTFVILLISLLLFIFSLQGCGSFSETVKTVRDPHMTQGCYVTVADIGFDSYFKTTKGALGTCKLKCTSELPRGFSYEFDDPRSGCRVQIRDVK